MLLHSYVLQAEIMFILIKYLCTSCGYELLVTRCRGHELHVNQEGQRRLYNRHLQPIENV